MERRKGGPVSLFDFNCLLLSSRHPTAFQLLLEAANESWPNRLLSTGGLPPDLPVSNLRRSIPRQSLRQRILLLGSVPFSGLCSAHLPRKSPRYRSLSARPATQALSYGFPGASFSQHVGPRQRASRLADLRRFRAGPDYHRPRPLPQRFGVELSETVYALDSTTIDLCLTLFPWGKFRRHKSAVKLHTLLDLRGSIPTNVYVTG